jgi:FG-GAP-like repeat
MDARIHDPQRACSSAASTRATAALLGSIGLALTFGLVGPSAAGTAASFAVPRHYATGAYPFSVAIGDVNADGRGDLVTANADANTVSVLLNRNGAGFRARHDYRASGYPVAVAIGDLNSDNKPDLAIANRGNGSISVLLNKGDGSFARKRDTKPGRGATSVAIGDLNGDGKPDLASADEFGSTVSVLVNRGHGRFGPARSYPTPPGRFSPVSVAIRDLNGDGRRDLVSASLQAAKVSVFLNGGGGRFAARRDYPTGGHPSSIAVGDLNHDHRPDLATVAIRGGTVSVFLNRGHGRLKARREYRAQSFTQGIVIGDLNSDHLPDLAVAALTTQGLSVLFNDGHGSFRSHRDYRVEYPPHWLALGDLNGDRKTDVALAYGDMNRVAVRLNSTGLCGVPNVVRRPLAVAKRIIMRSHCRLGAVHGAYSNSVERGRVALQKPAVGSVLPLAGRVELVISRGPEN